MIVAHLANRSHAPPYAATATKSSWFIPLDARAKVVGVFTYVVACAVITRPELIATSLIASLAFVACSRVDHTAVGRAYLSALPFILFASFSVFLFSGTEKGIAMLGRASACLMPLLVLVVGTESFDLFAGLRRLRVPWVITTLLMLTHRYILLFTEELSRLKTAKEARGHRGGRSLLDRYGLRVVSSTGAAVLLRAWDRADRVYEGLKVRGFERDMTAWKSSRFGAREVLFCAVLVGVSAAILAAHL